MQDELKRNMVLKYKVLSDEVTKQLWEILLIYYGKNKLETELNARHQIRQNRNRI